MGTPYCVKRQDLCIYQGDDYPADVIVSKLDDTAADLTGYSARAQVRRGAADEYPAVELEIDCTIQLPDTVALFIPKSKTVLLSGNYEWDLELTDSYGMVGTIMKGKVYVEQEVTRAAAIQGFAQAARAF